MLSAARNTTSILINRINEKLSEYSPTTIIAGTIAATVVLQKSLKIYQNWDTNQIKKSLTDHAVQSLMSLPYIGTKVEDEINKEVKGILSGIKNEVDESRAEWKAIEVLPEKGLSEEAILDRFKSLHKNYRAGKLSGAVYAEYDDKLSKLLETVWGKTALTNPMHSEWPLINLMEAEIISMCQNLLKGKPGAPGILTHGGSTSILEACKAYVLHARKKGIETPEIIVPDSVHVAFDKAANILNAKLIKIPVNEKTGAADVKAMEKAITGRTCLIVGSAPSFPFGIFDPIEALGKIAIKHKIPLHVDACLGGFLTAFAKEAGFEIPLCDFSVPGVKSISKDTHKYGEAPKGNSVLLFDPDVPIELPHVHLDWCSMYVTPSIDGSRSGADIATVWTVLCYKGKEEYVKETKAILTLQREFLSEIKKINGIHVPYNPQLSVIPIQSDEGINSLLVADRLKQAGWSVNILQTPDQKPAGFHFCLTSVHAHQQDFLKSFIHDLSEAVAYAKTYPDEKPKGIAKAYGKLEKGVPPFVQDRIGKGYIRIFNTLPNVPIPGIWSKPSIDTTQTEQPTPERKKNDMSRI